MPETTQESSATVPPSGPNASAAVDLPPAFREWLESPARLATFLFRLVLKHREVVRLLETFEPALLFDAFRALGVGTSLRSTVTGGKTLPHLTLDPEQLLAVDASLRSSVHPDALWLAWAQRARAAELNKIRDHIRDAARAYVEAARTTVSDPSIPRTATGLKLVYGRTERITVSDPSIEETKAEASPPSGKVADDSGTEQTRPVDTTNAPE